LKAFGRALTVTGWVLITVFVLAHAHAWVGSNVALAQLAATAPASPRTIPIEERTVDVSLWSDTRIADFREALGIPTAPPIAAIRVPRLGIEAPIFPGTDDLTLNRGVGWIKGTAKPGSDGNSCLAAHRDGFFRALKDVAQGDLIELEMDGTVKNYLVRSIEIVEPKDVSPLAQANGTALTLVTCYPFYFVGSAPQRFIVRATPAGPASVETGSVAAQIPSPNQSTSSSSN
jgi:sortase A